MTHIHTIDIQILMPLLHALRWALPLSTVNPASYCSFLNTNLVCPDVSFAAGAPGSVRRPLYHSPGATMQVTRRSNCCSTALHTTQGTEQPKEPSARCLQTTISAPALRLIQCTTWCLCTPALLALASQAFSRFLLEQARAATQKHVAVGAVLMPWEHALGG